MYKCVDVWIYRYVEMYICVWICRDGYGYGYVGM